MPAQLFIMPAGAFLTLGFLIAAVNGIKMKSAENKLKAEKLLEIQEKEAAQSSIKNGKKTEETSDGENKEVGK